MSDQDLLMHLISDLRKIRNACFKAGPGIDLQVIRRYLAENYDLIDFYITQVYTKLSKDERSELLKNHRELDYSALDETWYEYAMAAPKDAKDTTTGSPQRRATMLATWTVDHDEINCLLRGLEFAKYCSLDPNSSQLFLSPIDQNGLELYGYEAYQLTDEERNELDIPWYIADILYTDRKSRVIAECGGLGIYLGDDHFLLTFAFDERELTKSIQIIIRLLDDKLEYDLAVVYISSPKSITKCTNEILNRLWPELSQFRAAFYRFWLKGMVANKLYLELLDDYEKAVWNKILDIRPKPETYEIVRRMVGDNKKTEVVMGNKTTIGNISGSNVNINSPLIDATQTLNSSKNLDEDGKKQLADLIEQLKTELQKMPAANAEDAETIAEYAKNLVEAGAKEKPNRNTVKITAEGLKKAAENIAGVVPSVFGIASSIIKFVFQISGVPLP